MGEEEDRDAPNKEVASFEATAFPGGDWKGTCTLRDIALSCTLFIILIYLFLKRKGKMQEILIYSRLLSKCMLQLFKKYLYINMLWHDKKYCVRQC